MLVRLEKNNKNLIFSIFYINGYIVGISACPAVSFQVKYNFI
jgi:hypothetical protein